MVGGGEVAWNETRGRTNYKWEDTQNMDKGEEQTPQQALQTWGTSTGKTVFITFGFGKW